MSEIIPPDAPVKWAYDPVAYRAGLAEGFRRGVEAAADYIASQEDAIYGSRFLQIIDAIRALRPEGGK